MPDIGRPDDPHGLIDRWPEESETAYAATAEILEEHAAAYANAAEHTRAEASRTAAEWLGKSGEHYGAQLQIDAEKFTGHQVSAIGMSEQMTAAAGVITAGKNAITENVRRYSAVLDAVLLAEAQPDNIVKPSSTEVITAARAAIATEYADLDAKLTAIGNKIESLNAPAPAAPTAAPAAYAAAPDVATAVPAAVSAVEAPVPVTAALPSGAELPAAAVPAAPFSELDTDTPTDTPAPGAIPPSLGQMPAAMPTTQTTPAPAPAAPTAVPTAPAPAALPTAPAPISTGTGAGASSSPAPAPAPAADAPALATVGTPASSASAPALPLTLTPLTAAALPAPALPAMPAPASPASTELSAAPNPAQTRTPGSPAAATLFQAQQAPAPAMPMMPAGPMPTTPAHTLMPGPAPAPTATPASTAAAPAPAPASTAGDAVRRDSASVAAAAAGLPPLGAAEVPAPSYCAGLPPAEALAHRTLATIRRQFVLAGWVCPIAVAVLPGQHGLKAVYATADAISIIPGGAGLPVGVTPLDRMPGLDPGAADRFPGMSSPSAKLITLLPGAAVIVSTAVTDADGESVHHQRETEAAEIASAGELLPTTPGRAAWARTRPEDAPAEVLRLSLHEDAEMDAATAKVRLWAARWENTPRTDYTGLLRRWLLADAAECIRFKRLADAAWAVDQLHGLNAGRRAA